MTLAITLEDIQAAAERIKAHAVRTPLLESPLVNTRVRGRLLVKPECLQKTGSFKFRGAFNRVSQLTQEERRRGVVAFSSGNHAQGVALAAQMLDVPATIVMPSDAPAIKRANTEAYGGRVVAYDRFRESREAIAEAISQESGAVVVPSFDDPHIMAGQGTVGLEIAEDLEAMGLVPDTILVCCGGGGLSSGSFLALRDRFPRAELLTVEPVDFDDTLRSLEQGERQQIDPEARSICDALLSQSPGVMPFAVLRHVGARGVAVSDNEAMAAMKVAATDLKLVTEPGGAVALAAALSGKVQTRDKVTVAVVSGGNVDPDTLQRALTLA